MYYDVTLLHMKHHFYRKVGRSWRNWFWIPQCISQISQKYVQSFFCYLSIFFFHVPDQVHTRFWTKFRSLGLTQQLLVRTHHRWWISKWTRAAAHHLQMATAITNKIQHVLKCLEVHGNILKCLGMTFPKNGENPDEQKARSLARWVTCPRRGLWWVQWFCYTSIRI
jgi:hypothetical protein